MQTIKTSSLLLFKDRLELLKDFDPDGSIWVVSDLALKKRMKELLLEKKTHSHSGSVMRAQEFWLFLFNKLYPDFTVINDSLVKSILKNFLSKERVESFDNPQYVQTLLSSINSFILFFISPNAIEYFEEWLKKNPDPYLEKWFFLSFKAWKYLLKTKNIPVSFLPGILSADSISLFSFLKDKKITFDLGFQLKVLEVNCIRKLSKVLDVKILKPGFLHKSQEGSCLWVYSLLEGTSLYKSYNSHYKSEVLKEINSNKENKNIQFFKYDNQLAEIRGAIDAVKTFIKQGVGLDNIAIVSPDIEYLWPILSSQFKTEGLLVNKPVVSSFHSSKSVMCWLARLRLALGGVSYSDLELIFSEESKESKESISYKDLRHSFFNFYSAESYEKTKWSKGLLDQSVDQMSEINLSEFLAWAFSFWKKNNYHSSFFSETLKSGDNVADDTTWEEVYQALRTQGGEGLKLSLQHWLTYVEDILSKQTYCLEPESIGCVSFYNIINSDNLSENYIIALDLCFESLQAKSSSVLSFTQSLSLSEDLGISLDNNWGQPLEGVLKYLFQDKSKQIICSWSLVNLESKPQSASPFFLREYFLLHKEPLVLRQVLPNALNSGDLKQMQYKEGVKNEITKSEELSRVFYDKALVAMPKIESSLESISVTNINRYIECPFIFFAEKLLKLKDIPEWDLDMDVLTKGSLFHKLLELIISLHTVKTNDVDLLFLKLNNYRVNSLKLDDASWEIVKDSLLAIAKDFISLEKKQNLISPQLKVEFIEKSFEGVWDKKNQEFLQRNINENFDNTELPLKDKIFIKGKVDRLDRDGDFIVIRDYKTSINSKVGFKKWSEKKDLSLFLYYKLWKAQGHEGSFLGAFYFDIKKLTSKGIWVEEQKTYEFEGLPKSARASFKEKEEIFLELEKDLNQLLNNILDGNFFPNPKEKKMQSKTCNKCSWSGLCRISKTF